MNGQEIERLLSLIEANTTQNREQLIAYVVQNKERILADLKDRGESEIPGFGGEKIMLRNAA